MPGLASQHIGRGVETAIGLWTCMRASRLVLGMRQSQLWYARTLSGPCCEKHAPPNKGRDCSNIRDCYSAALAAPGYHEPMVSSLGLTVLNRWVEQTDDPLHMKKLFVDTL